MEECHERQEVLRLLRQLEAKVAAAVGLSMVYSSPALRTKYNFRRCALARSDVAHCVESCKLELFKQTNVSSERLRVALR